MLQSIQKVLERVKRELPSSYERDFFLLGLVLGIVLGFIVF